MFVEVNGARLFFDVEGAGLIPDGPKMRTKPTLLLLHGGPGFDHSNYDRDGIMSWPHDCVVLRGASTKPCRQRRE